MIEVVLFDSGEHLDVYADMDLSLERSNPFLLDRGSSSLPVKFPMSDLNIRLLGLLGVPGVDVLPAMEKDVILKLDGLEYMAVLIVDGVEDSAYLCSIIFGESLLYHKLEGVMMPDIFRGKSLGYLFDSIFTPDRLDLLIRNSQELTIVRAVTNEFFEGNSYNKYYCLTENFEEVSTEQTYKVDDVSVTALPMYRYGVHLKLKYVLDTIFSYFGFSLDLSRVSLYKFDYLVLLNNVFDLCVTGIIKYEYMVPTCEVSEFLTALRNTFLIEFYYDPSIHGFVAYSFDEVEKEPIPMTAYLSSPISMSYNKGQQLSITQDISDISNDIKYHYLKLNDYKPISNKEYFNVDVGLLGVGIIIEGIGANFSVLPSQRMVNTDIIVDGDNSSVSSDEDTPIVIVYGLTRTPIPYEIWWHVNEDSTWKMSHSKRYEEESFLPMLLAYNPVALPSGDWGSEWERCKSISDLYESRERQLLSSVSAKASFNLSIYQFLNLNLFQSIEINGSRYQVSRVVCKKSHNNISNVEFEMLSIDY